jgi:hypothetical protein
MPKASIESINEPVTAPGFEGRYAALLDYTVGFEASREESDMAPLFVGLPDDRCQCTHFGYVKKGSITYRTAEGEETFNAGDAYVVGPGHTPVLHPGTEVVEFSPTGQLNETLEVVSKNIANTPAAPTPRRHTEVPHRMA